MKAIPTTYKGINYRSMLEARYAAFFDLLDIDARYEPEAFDGYIPDFMIPTVWCEAVCEIKGQFEDFDLAKIRRSGWGIGKWRDNMSQAEQDVWCGIVLMFDGRGPLSGAVFTRGISSPVDVDCGPHEVSWEQLGRRGHMNHYGRRLQDFWYEAGNCRPVRAQISEYWSEAGNLVQWRGARTKTG